MHGAQCDINSFIGRDLGTVTLLKPLGRGTMGVVFLGFQRTLKRQVAVKILLKNSRSNPQSRDSFQYEAELVAGLNHPNIVPIFEMGEAEDCYYQIIQIVRGGDLDRLLQQRLRNPIPSRRTMPIRDSVQLITQVLDGLGYAHEEGVVHQDIKPANILLDERSGRPLIADFGIARTLRNEIRQEGTIVGSPLFMAPELVASQQSDPRSDIYAVGIMLFQMCVGVLPLTESSPMGILTRKIEAPDTVFKFRPSQVTPRIDTEFEAIILRAMASRPTDRYQSCKELRIDLEHYLAHLPPEPANAQT